MIKAVINSQTHNGRPLLLIGLSHGNLDRLRADGLNGHIMIEAVGAVTFDVIITAGETEAHIADALSEYIGPDTQVFISPSLKS